MIEPVEAALRAHSADLLAYLERRLEPEDAADALAETMLATWRRASDLPTDEVEARMWMFGIAHRVVANSRRSRARRHKLSVRLRETVRIYVHSADDGVEVRDAIARLDPELAEVVRLRHWEGFTLDEISRVVGSPPSTVRSRYARARERLARELATVSG